MPGVVSASARATLTGPAAFDERWRSAQRHQPFFCEENVWWLLTGDGLPRPRAAVFICNEEGGVAMWGQRAAAADPLIWDYHVVAALPRDGLIVDLDDRLRPAWPVADWLAHAFRLPGDHPLSPRFRVVDEEILRQTFSTDRRHMLDAWGGAVRPLPAWSPPYEPALGMTLPRFLNPRDDVAGVVVDADGLLALCSPSPAAPEGTDV
jgi:hypothetical protein